MVESSQQRRWSLTTQLSVWKGKADKPRQDKGVCKAATNFMLQRSKSNVKAITSLHPSPNCRYLNIFSGFAETWSGCGWQHSAFKKVHLLQQQKRLDFLPLLQATGSTTVHKPLSLLDLVTSKVNNTDELSPLSGSLHLSPPLSVHL